MSEIGDRCRKIDKARREKMQELMAEYDWNVYYPAKKQLRIDCGNSESGHNMRFIDTNPVGYPVFMCSICGMTEINDEK